MSAQATETRVLLYDAEATSALLGGVVSANWLTRKAGLGLIPCTRIGRRAMWSEENIAELIRENYCDPRNYGRKRAA